jgi:hypothetical protein
MQERMRIRESDSCGASHRVFCNHRFRILQSPRRMVNFTPEHFSAHMCVQAISFAQPLLQCSCAADPRFTHWTICPAEGRLNFPAPDRLVPDPGIVMAHCHLCRVIRQAITQTRRPACQTASGIEAQEKDPGLAAIGDVGADIHLGKCGNSREGRRSAQSNSAHVKGSNRQPAPSLELIEGEGRRNQGSESFRRNRPVREQKIVPGLPHDPRPARERPWAMLSDFEQRVQSMFLSPHDRASVRLFLAHLPIVEHTYNPNAAHDVPQRRRGEPMPIVSEGNGAGEAG